MPKKAAGASKTSSTKRKPSSKKKEASLVEAEAAPLSFEEWAALAPVPCIILSDQPDGQHINWEGWPLEDLQGLLLAIGWVDAVMYTKAEVHSILCSKAATDWKKEKKK